MYYKQSNNSRMEINSVKILSRVRLRSREFRKIIFWIELLGINEYIETRET